MKLIHFADSHLGFRAYGRSDGRGRNQREIDVTQAFAAALSKIIELKPQIVVVGGDVFHNVRPTNPAIIAAYSGFRQLREALPECEVVICAGNPDLPRSTDTGCLLGLFSQLGIHVAMDRVKRFDLLSGEIAVTAVPEGIKPRPEFEPFAQARYNVLLLHGEVEGIIGKGAQHQAVKRETIELSKVADDRWSYVALGHYHNYTKVAERAFYSGSLDYTSSDVWSEARSGIGKGIIEHDLASGAHTFHQLALARRVIDLPPLSAIGLTSSEVMEKIIERVESCEGGIDDQIVRLVMTDIEKHITRDLNHRLIREYQKRAMHFSLDARAPDIARRIRGEAPSFIRRRMTLAEIVGEHMATRPITPGIDRGELTALALKYLGDVEAREEQRSKKAIIEAEKSQSQGEPINENESAQL